VKENILKRANDVVTERGKVYGHPLKDFSRTAMIWSGILGIDVKPDQVAMCMIGLKLSRLVETPGHEDSILDIAGYTWCLEQCIDGEKNEDKQKDANTKSEGTVKSNDGAWKCLRGESGIPAPGFVIKEESRCHFCGVNEGAEHLGSCLAFRKIPGI
jgi:hypothetical protein